MTDKKTEELNEAELDQVTGAGNNPPTVSTTFNYEEIKHDYGRKAKGGGKTVAGKGFASNGSATPTV